MRDGPPTSVVHGTRRVRCDVSSWRGGRLLTARLPIDGARAEWTTDSTVPGRLTLDLPLTDEWVPRGQADHPLAPFGQRLSVTHVTEIGNVSHLTDLGWWLVTAWSAADTNISVEAVTLEQLVLDSRFLSPYVPPGNATFTSTLAALCAGILPTRTVGLTDRALPTSIADGWDEDRLGALTALAAAWPARLAVDASGTLVASPPATVNTSPDVTWQHGTAGAFVSWGSEGVRDRIYNAVVARGEGETDGAPVQAVAYQTTGPTAWDGPFGQRPRFYSSPLITTAAQAASAAASVLADEQRRVAEVIVTAPPDPRVEVGDTAAVVLADGTTMRGVVVDVSLPLTALEGAATYTIGEVSA